MDGMKKLQIEEKMCLLEDFMALSLRRENVAADAIEMLTEAKNLSDLMKKVESAMQERLAKVELEYAALMSRMRKQQLVILEYVLNEKKITKLDTEKWENEAKKTLSSLKPPASNDVLDCSALRNLKLQGNVITPKITLSNYKESPLVKRCRINPIPFALLDFEYRVTSEQFNKIPKYMRGRETVDELNNFLDTVVIPCFNKKYQLMHRKRNTVRNRHDLELWKMYNEQVSYVPGRNFITQGDISQHLNKTLDKKQQNRMVMLRHLGVLQEQRVSQTACYIWAGEAAF